MQPSPPDSSMKEILSSGHYYSFDKDNTYEPVMAMTSERKEAADNLETSAELLNIERSLRELSQRQARDRDGAGGNVRHSFLSVDSGNKEYYQRSGLSVIMYRPQLQ